MSDVKTPNTAAGTDWTRLLSDPDLVSHLGKLLQTYREAAPDKREEALLAAMREIKNQPASGASEVPAETASAAIPAPTPVMASATPPFEPDIFTPSWGEDRRRYPRIKCFVAVELKVDGSDVPIWGNLSNTSMGGCYVETVTPVKSGADVQIGLWVSSGKIWVKGLILNGIVIKSNPCFGVRVRFDFAGIQRETLKQFLKFVESSTKAEQSEHSYLQKLQK
jgi:PilZ domain-containing protein